MSLESPWKRPWMKFVLGIVFFAAAIYGLIYRDVVSRAKESYLMGEKYMDWAAHPDQKKSDLDAKYASLKTKLDQKKEKQKISADDYQREVESLMFDHNQELQESSLKYAYQWYKDTFELFSPPESNWVRLAREKAPVALDLWKKELDQNKVPYTATMFE